MSDVGYYRIEAEKCRRLAAKAVDPINKDALQRMADEWLRLAQTRDAKSSNGETRTNTTDPV